MVDGVGALALVFIASFGIDRIVTGTLFALSFFKPWARFLPEPRTVSGSGPRERAERHYKLVYFLFAAVLGIGVLAYFGQVRIFAALGFDQTNPLLDAVITGLILVAGADRISQLVDITKKAGPRGLAEPASPPIEVTGKLVLEGAPLAPPVESADGQSSAHESV